MAKNPMQRKAQNSFLLGMLITLLITGVIIAFLVLQLTNMTRAQKEEEAKLKTTYVLSQDINSGDSVTADKLQSVTVSGDTIPSNAINSAALEQKMNVFDEEGNLIKKVNIIAKINLKKGTVLTEDMIAEEGEIANDIRKVEYNMITMPSQIETDKYVDVRLQLPDGKDLIVVSHKKIEIPNVDGIDSTNTIWMNLNETEILTLSCAIIEAYKIEGSKLYLSEYVEPGLQTAAELTYLPDDAIINLINRDPNCVDAAKQAIFARNNDENIKNAVRNSINSALTAGQEDAMDNVIDKMQEEIQKTQEERQKYLDALGY